VDLDAFRERLPEWPTYIASNFLVALLKRISNALFKRVCTFEMKVDPDAFRERLPEWPTYITSNPGTAGRLTHRVSPTLVSHNAFLD
jgi:hypothetical protein